MTDQTAEPDNPAAYALARHIADHPLGTVQAAFRYLNAGLAIELREDPDATAGVAPATDQAAEVDALWNELHRRDTETDHPHATDQAALLHVFRVSEIRDNVLRRVHGYFASLEGAFAYCETQERTPSTIASARFELFPAPGGDQWLIHAYYGPDDPCPETSDLLITRVEVIPDKPQPADAVLREAATFVEAMNEGCGQAKPCASCDAREDVAAELRRAAESAPADTRHDDSVCGEPAAQGTVHRTDGPCYVDAAAQQPKEARP